MKVQVRAIWLLVTDVIEDPPELDLEPGERVISVELVDPKIGWRNHNLRVWIARYVESEVAA